MADKSYPNPLNGIYGNGQLSALIEDALQVTSDAISGITIYYLPRSINTQDSYVDGFFEEIKNRKFDNMIMMKFVPDEPTTIQTNADVFSKFGLQIQDEGTFWISRREFRERITGTSKEDMTYNEARQEDIKPTQGDLFYIPMMENVFEVTWCENYENLIYGFKSFFKIISKKYQPKRSDEIVLTDVTAEDEQWEKQQALDVLNEIEESKNDEYDNILDEEYSTGFDPSDSNAVNDDVKVKNDSILDENDPNDLHDIFGNF